MSTQVDWSDPKCKISRHFSVKEALWLHRWDRLADTARDGVTEHVKAQILALAPKMDLVRDLLGVPIITHRWFSPVGYNALVGGKRGSKHLSLGPWSAVDFHVNIYGRHDAAESCTRARELLEPKLEEWGLRMERMPGAAWVHLDDAPVVFSRYFNPGSKP